MDRTVTYLRQFVTPEMLDSTEEELATSYKLTHDDRIIAALFIKLMPITVSISKKFTSVEKETVISFCMMTIGDLSKTFDVSKNVKFKTYYINSLKRLMYMLLKPQMYIKRVCPTDVISMSDLAFSSAEKGLSPVNDREDTIQDVLPDKYDACRQSDSELFVAINELFDPLTAKIIICLAQGYSRTETANLLNIDVKCVYSAIRKNKNVLKSILK